MSDKSQCHAAMLIKACRMDADLKSKVLAGDFGLLSKHFVENEHAWTEEELYGKGDKAIKTWIDAIGLKAEMRDKAEITFAAAFYHAIAFHFCSVHDAFEMGVNALGMLMQGSSVPTNE
jgi:hypothetical protein